MPGLIEDDEPDELSLNTYLDDTARACPGAPPALSEADTGPAPPGLGPPAPFLSLAPPAAAITILALRPPPPLHPPAPDSSALQSVWDLPGLPAGTPSPRTAAPPPPPREPQHMHRSIQQDTWVPPGKPTAIKESEAGMLRRLLPRASAEELETSARQRIRAPAFRAHTRG